MLSGSFCYITCHCEICEFRMTIFACLFVSDSVVQELEAASAGLGHSCSTWCHLGTLTRTLGMAREPGPLPHHGFILQEARR